MLELHQKLDKTGLFQIWEITNKKEIFDQQYKIYKDKTSKDVQKVKLLLLDIILKSKSLS